MAKDGKEIELITAICMVWCTNKIHMCQVNVQNATINYELGWYFAFHRLYNNLILRLIHNLPVVTFIAFEWELGGNCVSWDSKCIVI